jgi:tRNA pseudouridine55 synthase
MAESSAERRLDDEPGSSGLLLIDKPAGITSHDVVDRIRRGLGTRKVGHAGTLDPLATGLLLIGVGRATRLLRFLLHLPKVYEGTGRLGIETTTLDAEGEVTRRSEVGVSEQELRAAMDGFVGDIEQVPPAYSAVKVGGRKLYEAARHGRAVEAAPRRVRVEAFDLLRLDGPLFDFRVRCSSGTYVRSLVADVGGRLQCGAHLVALRRTAIGPHRVETAAPPDAPGSLLALERTVDHLEAILLTDEEARAAIHGTILGPAGIEGPYRVLGPDGGLIGIYSDRGAKAVPEVIIAPA